MGISQFLLTFSLHLKLIDDFHHRSWQERRLIYSRDMIVFSCVDEEVVIDAIPMTDILDVSEVECDTKAELANLRHDRQGKCERNEKSEKNEHMRRVATMVTETHNVSRLSMFQNAFQITTEAEGYNSGRKYILETSSPEACEKIIEELRDLTRAARKLAEIKSRFQRSQTKVKLVFESNVFRIIMSLLIIVVRNPRTNIKKIENR